MEVMSAAVTTETAMSTVTIAIGTITVDLQNGTGVAIGHPRWFTVTIRGGGITAVTA